MGLLASLRNGSAKKIEAESHDNIRWSEFSDLYVTATSGDGFTALASKPAASLAAKINLSANFMVRLKK
jgi:hypothetical protein